MHVPLWVRTLHVFEIAIICLNSVNAKVFFIKGYIVISCTPVNVIVYLVYFFFYLV